MNAALKATVESQLEAAGGEAVSIVASRPVSGGCINHGEIVELTDGRALFVKSNAAPLPGLFEREAQGLRALAAVGSLRVPAVVHVSDGGAEVPFLVLEAIRPGKPAPDFFADFGRRFAEHHRRGGGERFGFEDDNYLGSTLQPNAWGDDWCEFWRRRRLGHQLELARLGGDAGETLHRLGDRLLDRLDDWLAEPDEPPCLLHGDLWGGNYLIDEGGRPVLIDPAAYYGRREADLAMTRLFGGFDPTFYRAYEEVWPLEPGAEERQQIYQLYHLLNHLNLFGGGYLGSCERALRRLVG